MSSAADTDPRSTPRTPEPGQDTRLYALHVLRLVGMASSSAVADFAGLPHAEVDDCLAAATGDGHVLERTGRISGFVLTAEGRSWHVDALATELDRHGARDAVAHADEQFIPLNTDFKQICTDWQLRGAAPNDHSDADHDRAVIARLGDVHGRIVQLTTELSAALPRFAWYAPRFENAWRRLEAGETRALAAPMAESYHDTWMALHQDLMSTLGRERSAGDGH